VNHQNPSFSASDNRLSGLNQLLYLRHFALELSRTVAVGIHAAASSYSSYFFPGSDEGFVNTPLILNPPKKDDQR
jgi:hypothetical protein